MSRWARIENNAVVEKREFGVDPDPNPAKGLDWRPCPKIDPPAYDPTTHVLEQLPDDIQPDIVNEGWNVRPKTQAELDAELAARKEQEARLIDRTLGKALFIHENRIRALEGLQPITKEQFRDWFKDQVT